MTDTKRDALVEAAKALLEALHRRRDAGHDEGEDDQDEMLDAHAAEERVEVALAAIEPSPEEPVCEDCSSSAVELCHDVRHARPEDCPHFEPSPEHDNEWFNRQFLDPEFRAAYEAELKAEWELERAPTPESPPMTEGAEEVARKLCAPFYSAEPKGYANIDLESRIAQALTAYRAAGVREERARGVNLIKKHAATWWPHSMSVKELDAMLAELSPTPGDSDG